MMNVLMHGIKRELLLIEVKSIIAFPLSGLLKEAQVILLGYPIGLGPDPYGSVPRSTPEAEASGQ